ncbi:MAG: hypothetical protein Q4F00_05285 [bacterium]|nr:hypothetical protein [bacterium]
MKIANFLSMAAVGAGLLFMPVGVCACANNLQGGLMAMAAGDGGQTDRTDTSSEEDSSQPQEEKMEQQEYDKSKFDMKLNRRLREHPIDADNGSAMVRVTAKTTDRGAEMKQFLQNNGGIMGSCHGSIVTAQIPYRSLPGLSRLATVTRIEGDVMLWPHDK